MKLPFSTKTYVLSIVKWPLQTGFTVLYSNKNENYNDVSFVWISIAYHIQEFELHLTLLMLSPDISCFEISVDPDQHPHCL